MVALILFVLTRYHSPQLAGATAFFAIFQGIVVSPLAGPLIAHSLDLALFAAAGVALLAAVFPMLLIPAQDDARVPVT